MCMNSMYISSLFKILGLLTKSTSSTRHRRFTSLLRTSDSGSSKSKIIQHCFNLRISRADCSLGDASATRRTTSKEVKTWNCTALRRKHASNERRLPDFGTCLIWLALCHTPANTVTPRTRVVQWCACLLPSYLLHLPTEGWPGWTDLDGWFCIERYTRPEMVSHPGTNRDWCNTTSLIKSSALRYVTSHRETKQCSISCANFVISM